MQIEETAIKNLNRRNSLRLYENLPPEVTDNLLQTLHELKRQILAEIGDLEKDRDQRLLEQVVTMQAGTGFGELALEKERLVPRAATIQCARDCHLAVINKEDYDKVLRKIEQR